MTASPGAMPPARPTTPGAGHGYGHGHGHGHADGVEVLILGAGINGAGVFRDLCAQGVRCLLVDKQDIGAGTSAASSRLIHGGLKYLETGEFGLVAQSTLERNLLLKNAPHFVEPLPTLIPIFSWFGGIGAALRTLAGSTTAPRSRGAALIKIGLTIYDRYGSRDRTLPRHTLAGRRRTLASLPALRTDIVAAGLYHDALIRSPERLVMELVSDALHDCPASGVATHTLLSSVSDGALTFRGADGEPFTVRPGIVVNAAGPWIDSVNARLGAPTAWIGGTRGSHLLLRNDALVAQLDGRMIYFEADDGRICLVFDYLGLALVGSTDIPADDPDEVRCEPPETDYLLESVAALLPGVEVQRDQIVYAYSGIRPLPVSDAANPGLISRDHSAPLIEPDAARPFPIVSLVGGKWTTYRGFAEEVTDDLLTRLGRKRKLGTRVLPIGGGRDFPVGDKARAGWLDAAARDTGLDRARLDTLLTRYGTTARRVAAHARRWSDADRLPDATSWSLAEIDRIVREELVVGLADVVMRRTTLAITGGVTRADLEAIARVTGEALGWDEARGVREVDDVIGLLAGRHMMGALRLERT